jgi:Penicillin binding protein transpeptidase domain
LRLPTGYKYINGEKVSKRRRSFRKFLFILPILFLLAVILYASYFLQTRGVEEKILIGNYDEASKVLNHWKLLPLVNGRVYEALGTIQLMKQNTESAAPYFERAIAKPFFRPLSIWQDILKILWGNGRYHEGLYYAQHLQKKYGGDQKIHFYKAGFLAGENQLANASRELQAAGNIPEFTPEIGLLKSEIEQRTTTGHCPFLIDRENLPVVNLTLKGNPIYLSDTIRPLLINSKYDLVDSLKKTDPENQTVLTIDVRIQNAAERALDKYAGAIVVLDVKNGDILAATSSLRGVRSNHPDGTSLAMTEEYEPASIIKLITLAGILEHGVDLKKIVPYQCDGYLKLRDNKVLYCSTKHGVVKDVNIATAVSCNVGFAKMGLSLKPADLIANLKQFGFNDRLNGMTPVDLGKIKEGQFDDEYVSKLSIGLDYLNITPLHAAMVASAIASKGECLTPRLISGYKNIVGLPFGILPSVEYRKFMSEKTAHVLTEAMLEVVKNPEGTGRRVMLPSFPMALKTGTAGTGADGYDAVIIGFGPVPNPKIAFAIFLEHAGKAEFEGARITRLFLESIQGYI